MAKVKKNFRFILPMSVMRNGNPDHKGDLTIEGLATDHGNQLDGDPRFETYLDRVLFRGVDILPVLDWLEAQPDVDMLQLQAAVDAHIAKLFEAYEIEAEAT